MSDDSKVDLKTILVGVAVAVVGLATLGAIFYYIVASGAGAAHQWQRLGMFAVAVAIAFAVVAMLRFALAPLISPQPAPRTTDADAAIRSRIAPLVLSIGSIAIVVLAAALIVAFAILAYVTPQSLGSKVDTLLTGVFTTVLPVIATWVGTVLAFYFGSENFRQAAQSTREALGQLAPKKKITDVMIPYERIAHLEAENDQAAGQMSMLKVIHTMSEAAPRIIVFTAKTHTPLYVIRSGSPPMPQGWITSDYQETDAVQQKTINDYLNENNGQNKTDAVKFRFIDQDATPEAALALMTKEGVDDLFITKDGQKTSPVLGWVAAQDLLED